MSKQIITTRLDDIDGTPNAQTYRFGLGEQMFEIDLSPANAARFRQTMGAMERRFAKYTKNARVMDTKVSAPMTVAKRSNESSEIRAWAKEQGFFVSERGRISIKVREAFAEAHMGN